MVAMRIPMADESGCFIVLCVVVHGSIRVDGCCCRLLLDNLVTVVTVPTIIIVVVSNRTAIVKIDNLDGYYALVYAILRHAVRVLGEPVSIKVTETVKVRIRSDHPTTSVLVSQADNYRTTNSVFEIVRILTGLREPLVCSERWVRHVSVLITTTIIEVKLAKTVERGFEVPLNSEAT